LTGTKSALCKSPVIPFSISKNKNGEQS